MSEETRWTSAVPAIRSGASPASGREPILSTPGVVTWLVLSIGDVFLAQVILPGPLGQRLEGVLAFQPQRFTEGMSSGVNPFELAVPLIGHIFLHGGIAHILFNLVWLLVFGTGVARRMGVDWGSPGERAFRSSLFLTFFLLCGIAGVMTYYVLQPDSPVYLVGASGAISGLMGGAMRFVVPSADRQRDPTALARLTSAPVMAVSAMFIVINLFTALGGGAPGGANIAWEAHIGGYVAGLILFPAFDVAMRRIRQRPYG